MRISHLQHISIGLVTLHTIKSHMEPVATTLDGTELNIILCYDLINTNRLIHLHTLYTISNYYRGKQ